MIKLEELSKEDRYNFVRGCEPFYIAYKSPNWQKKILKTLCEEFGNKYKIELKVILTSVAKAKRYNMTGSRFSLGKGDYVTANKRTGLKISLLRMKELLGLMDDANYLTILLGYFKSRDDSMKTCLRFSNKLLRLLKKKHCDKWGMSRTEGVQFLEVVDTENSTKYHKKFHSLKKFKGSGIIRDEVNNINSVMGENTITFDGDVCVVIYKRRFEDDLYNAGRLYTIGTFQTECADLRHTIRINGEETVEVDIKHIHPSLMASKLGIKLPDGFDPYDINYILNYKGDLKKLRSLIKVCTMCLFYAKHRGSALYEIRTKLKEDNTIVGLTANDILEALEEHNYALHEFYYTKDMWKFNQFMDSSIIVKVMTHFANKGVVALSYHDSVRVAKKHLDELIIVMRQSWIEVVGNDDNFKYTIDE